MVGDRPLVSVGIPTYNRLDKLQLAVASVLAQDYPAVELVVSDNASTDGTAEWLGELVRTNPGVVVHTNATNVGPTANFNQVRSASTGPFLLWLGDDDVLDPSYVSACVAALEANPDAVLAAGEVRYDEGQVELRAGVRVTCLEASGSDRVRSYYRQVKDNGTFYGVTRRSAAERIPPMANRMGNDWYLMAGLAYQGHFLAVDGTSVVRSVGGATRSLRHVARSADLSWIEAEVPQLAIAWLALRDIGWGSDTYDTLGSVARLRLGLSAARVIVVRFVIPSIPKYLRLQWDRVRRTPPS